MIGVKGLNHDLPRDLSPSGASCNLSEDLESPFSGSEVREIHRHIRVYDDNEADTLEVVTLGKHLGADQESNKTTVEIRQ